MMGARLNKQAEGIARNNNIRISCSILSALHPTVIIIIIFFLCFREEGKTININLMNDNDYGRGGLRRPQSNNNGG